MYQQLGLVDLVGAVIDKIKENTTLKCYDAVPKNAPSPFYFVEVAGSMPVQSKTMFVDSFTIWVHCIAEKGDSSVQVYELINKVQEALTEDITLPKGFELLAQTNQGIQTIKQDETKEKHAVLAYEFKICYGLKCK